MCVVHRMLGWSVSQFCRIAWCWRSSCVCPMMLCWEPVWPADSGWQSPEMSSFGGSCFTATTAYHALYPDTQVNEYNHIFDRGNLTVLCRKKKEENLWQQLCVLMPRAVSALMSPDLLLRSGRVMVQRVQTSVWLYPLCGGSDPERTQWPSPPLGFLSQGSPVFVLL